MRKQLTLSDCQFLDGQEGTRESKLSQHSQGKKLRIKQRLRNKNLYIVLSEGGSAERVQSDVEDSDDNIGNKPKPNNNKIIRVMEGRGT